jgi:hypothetical protein
MKKEIKQLLKSVNLELRRVTSEMKQEERELQFHQNLYQKYKDFTMIPEREFVDNLELCRRHTHIKGVIVECGVWRGGMSAAMSEVLGRDRTYFLFDSFEGLPDAKEIDGNQAIAWQANKTSPGYYNNCKAEEEYAHKAMQMAMVKNYYTKRGWFSETLPFFPKEEKIALLRLDGDWYDSTMDCLVNLFDKVVPGGIIIIDDYYMWDGCSRAVHDFLSTNKRVERISRSLNGVCFIYKH